MKKYNNRMKGLVAWVTALMLILTSFTGFSIAETPEAEPFQLWNPDAAARNELVEYLAAITDESSPDYIPVKDRIAVFDLDGTLMCETDPFCFEYMVFADFALNHADQMPEEVLAVAHEILDAAGSQKPSGMSVRQAAAAAVAYQGMTMAELSMVVENFKASEAWGFTGMTRGEAWYKPMVQLVEQLQANGFTVYIVTATERNIVRQVIAGVLDIPPSQVIGTEYGYTATNQGDTADADYTFRNDDQIVFDGNYYGENAKTSKVDAIVREIGQQPVLAFGNSSGDQAMAVYTISNNPYRSAAYMVLADDDVREWGDPQNAAEKKASYEAMGIGTISMRDDFLTIYGDGVAKDPLVRYQLEQVVVLSRHNLRAPLSSNGSVPNELTPHSWINWSAGPSELTLLGGIEETSMGQYFRKWLVQEGLIPENYIPEEGEVRFNARDKQRCKATARYFAAGMLPLADIQVEHPGDDRGTEDFMQPVLHFYSDEYAADATAQVAAMGGETGFDGLAEQNRDVIRLIMDTVDMQDSEIYQSGKYGNLLNDGFGYIMEADKEPDFTGAIKPVYQVADALLLQYYEEPDAAKAAFGHELTEEDWAEIGKFMTTCLEMKHGAPLVAANITNPLLRELKSELQNDGSKFSFFCAHDCTVLGTLSALGAKNFALPESIETKTPIGVKLVFERRRDQEGQAWYRVSLIYRSTEQIRSGEMLTLDNPPLRYDLKFEDVKTNADGLISETDLFNLFDRSVGKLDELETVYGQANAAASEQNMLETVRERGILRIGTTGDYKPMSFLDPETGAYWGFDTELAEDLAASLDVEIEYVPTSWPTLMEDTLAGKFDLAICGITITDARKGQALMSEGYLKNGKTVLCRTEEADRYTSLEAINQPEVRVMENPGGLNEKFARENLPDATLIIHDVNQEIPGLVASGEADVMITEIMEAGYYVGQDSRLAAPLIYEPFTSGQLGVLIPKGSDDLLEYVNGFLAEEKKNGRLDELAEKYIYRYITTTEELQPAA